MKTFPTQINLFCYRIIVSPQRRKICYLDILKSFLPGRFKKNWFILSNKTWKKPNSSTKMRRATPMKPNQRTNAGNKIIIKCGAIAKNKNASLFLNEAPFIRD